MPSYPSPAYDINGNEVTIDLEGGDYSNLPEGYYTTPGQATIARAVEQQTGTPATAQDVYDIYSDTSAENQQAVQEIFNDPPPPSDYQAPEPPLAQGWTPPAVTPPPTSEQLIAQMYINNGYTPPPPAVLTAIATGQVVAPLTDPLPVSVAAPSTGAPQTIAPAVSGVDIPPSSAQTANTPAPTMSGIHPDTAAFVVGKDANGNAIMELIDADGHLVQWVPGVVNPFYVTAAPIVNEKRLIGGDDDGNPVFQLIDTAGTLVQWTENTQQTGYVRQPFAVSTGNLPGQNQVLVNTPVTSQPANTNVPSTTTGVVTQDLSRPQIQVGTTSKGFPVYQIQDSAGIVKQWIIDPGPPSAIVDLVNAPTYGLMVHDAVTDAAVAAAGGGTITGGGGNNSGGGTGVVYSGDTHERPQIQVGTTPRGFPIYQIQDAAGIVKQWIIDPGPPSSIVDLRNVPVYGTLVHTNATDEGAPAGGGATEMSTQTQKSGTTVLLLALGAGALWLFNQRQR